ncbi:ROK family protein [Actinoplanes missouriensis]|uniref:ROK family protein n=1 Tax=Actinoplanes missouriensis TaxID=1866 RepID=UPI003403B0D7
MAASPGSAMTAPAGVVAVDIGGTKIAVALVDDAGVVHQRVDVATPRGGSAILCVVAELVAGVCSRAAVRAVGVGAPGVIDPVTGAVRSATDILPGWAGTPVRERLAARLGLPVAVANDVRAAALGAAHSADVREHRDILHVSVGTGIGGALIRDRRMVTGPHAVTGEIAHLLVPATGAVACGCGRFDHLEAVAAGPAIAAAIAGAAGAAAVARAAAIAGTAGAARGSVLPLDRVAGLPEARAIIGAAASVLGRTLAGLVAAVDVDAITLGGGVVLGIPEFAGVVRDAFQAEALPPLRTVPVLVPAAGPDAPLLGAAHLARRILADPVPAPRMEARA